MSFLRRWFRAEPPVQEEPIPPEIIALRGVKQRERDRKAAAEKRVEDCGRDGGHEYGEYGKCVGCGCHREF